MGVTREKTDNIRGSDKDELFVPCRRGRASDDAGGLDALVEIDFAERVQQSLLLPLQS